ncbi:MAG TPA: HAMP domain-containing histidine kinase, partial [Sorangium sp.]|nr:HAMP domain-containing histidine kinase [Sorangium sp.]
VSRLLELSRIEAATEEMVEVALGSLIARVIHRTHSEQQPVRWRDRQLLSPPAAPPRQPTPHREPAPGQSRGQHIQAGRLRCRPADVERALLNLVENALRFSPPGEAVEISVEPTQRWLAIAVTDHGPGVASDERERIFQRFYTTDVERSGTGLGLAIARSVARSHGGDVVVSDRGPGATFIMTLLCE